jgi:hypothetical protein
MRRVLQAWCPVRNAEKYRMVKFAIALVIILVLCVIAGVIRKLRGGTFLPQPERDEDRLFMDKDGRWWRKDPQSGAVVEALRPSPEDRRAVRGSLKRFFVFLLVLWIIVLAVVFFMDGR